MRIFVVGGAGYIGSVCAELLLDEGHEVTIFDNLTEGHQHAVDSRANFFHGELADRAQIQAALSNARPDAVMHFAANALVGESMRDPSKYFRNNICNGLNLLDAMVATGIQRIVFSSTCAIFGLPERNDAGASDQSIRRIEARLRKNPALVRSDPWTKICVIALLQRSWGYEELR